MSENTICGLLSLITGSLFIGLATKSVELGIGVMLSISALSLLIKS